MYEENDRLLKVDEVAEKLRVSVPWVYAHANGHREPHLPSKKYGGARRFLLSEVNHFIQSHAQTRAA
jgi:predicted DNA-binding transcriptional regulator AlpA